MYLKNFLCLVFLNWSMKVYKMIFVLLFFDCFIFNMDLGFVLFILVFSFGNIMLLFLIYYYINVYDVYLNWWEDILNRDIIIIMWIIWIIWYRNNWLVGILEILYI